jgi:hypothetical protein
LCITTVACAPLLALLQRQQQTMRQVMGAWQLQVYRVELLRHALARLLHKTLAEAFGVWRQLALLQMRRRLLLHVSESRVVLMCAVLLLLPGS